MPGVGDAVGVTVIVGDGNADNGSGMHPAIGESTSPILTATAMPATSSKNITVIMDKSY